MALETLGVGSVRCGTRLRRTRRRTTGGGQGCYHDVEDVDLVDQVVAVVVVVVVVVAPLMRTGWMTKGLGPGTD